MFNYVLCAVFVVIAIFIISTILGSFFSVRTQTAAVIERFGKFNRVAEPGLNFKLPFVEAKNEVSLVTFQLEGSIETKTKDNVFLSSCQSRCSAWDHRILRSRSRMLITLLAGNPEKVRSNLICTTFCWGIFQRLHWMMFF